MMSANEITIPGALLFRAKQQPLAAIGVVLLTIFIICALFAPWLAPQDPAQLDLTGRLASPNAAHWFGTDELGRDILSRTLYGARISLIVAVSVVSLSLALGLVAGGLAGFYGGWTDTILNVYVTNAFLALPGILLAIAFVAFMGPGLVNVILALALSGWVGYARLVRAQVMAVKEREFVEAARALGASDLRIMRRHLLPNILQPLIVQAAIGMAGAVLAEATLSFLGLGIHAQRCPLAPVRLATPGLLSRHGRHAVRALVQLYWGRFARLSRPQNAALRRLIEQRHV
jgi:peptide/nickel transport system permease protein